MKYISQQPKDLKSISPIDKIRCLHLNKIFNGSKNQVGRQLLIHKADKNSDKVKIKENGK